MDSFALGGKITLAGFSGLGRSDMVIIKKMVGNFLKKAEDGASGPVRLNITLKPVHETGTNRKYQFSGLIDNNGNIKQAQIIDYNLFFALNKVLDKLG